MTLITHPTNRLVPHRAGYDLDYDALFAIARPREGMILELEFDLAARSQHAVLRDSG